MTPGDLLIPSAAKALAQGSTERALGRLAMRQLWHVVFDPCPNLARRHPPDGWGVLEPFLEHAAREKLSMRWSLHGHILDWLAERQPASVTPEAIQELLAAAVARWTNSDQTAAKGLLLRFDGMPHRGVVGWKAKTAVEDHRAVLVELKGPPIGGPGVRMCVLGEYGYGDVLDWKSLER